MAAVDSAQMRIAASQSLQRSNWSYLASTTIYNTTRGYGWLAPLPSITKVVSTTGSALGPLGQEYLAGTIAATLRLDMPVPLTSTANTNTNYDANTKTTNTTTTSTGSNSSTITSSSSSNNGSCFIVTVFTGSLDGSREVATTAMHITVPTARTTTTVTTGATVANQTHRANTVLALPGEVAVSGTIGQRSFQVRDATSVDITFYASTIGSFYGDGYGEGLVNHAWLLNGIAISSDCSSSAVGTPPAGGQYLDRSAALAASSLLDFAEIGLFGG
jgi:hypothetical protein